MNRRTFSLSLLATGIRAEAPSDAAARAIATDGSVSASCRIERRWSGNICRSRVTNHGRTPVRLHEIVLFDLPHDYPAEAQLYGEGFTMLSQTGGTLGKPEAIGGYLDSKHYRIPEPADATTVYSAACVSPSPDRHELFAFTSCRRFSGRFHFRTKNVQATLDCEGLELGPGQSWQLEDFTRSTGPDRAALFAALGDRIASNHPPLKWPAPPEGWCSWYCFGAKVTADQVRENLAWIAANAPNLRYVQIDDGYQPAMGDWLEPGASFGGDVRAVLREIKQRGFEPAIWVAPFIAEKDSKLFRQHPDWFMKDEAGAPLPSDKVTFGGWRRGPWYALDGTHPGAQAHLRELFRTLNREWGCTYFKLDANFWGAMHGARLHDPTATRIEAYRRGMKAIIEGAGRSFILGCNHPVWGSLGLIHGSRSSGDISRRWTTIQKVASENLNRAWQNGRLWWNDPDALVLAGSLPENEFGFHAAATYATGGMLLSGDDLPKLTAAQSALLGRLRPTSRAAEFDAGFRVGRMKMPGRELVFLLNPSDEPSETMFTMARAGTVRDLLSGEDLGRREGLVKVTLGARSARVLEMAG